MVIQRSSAIAQRPIRLADVAKRVGLTTVAVSKALRDLPDISVKTRERVKQTAAEMGYVPNYFAKSLQSNRSNVLGVIIPKIRHPFFAEVVAGIQTAAVAQGYEMLLAISDEDAEVERKHIETFLGMRVAGLLISAVDDPHASILNAEIYRKARLLDVPMILFDRLPVVNDYDAVAVVMDDRVGARAAVMQAIARGYREIAHLAAGDHLNIGRGRRTGFEDALSAHGLTPRVDWVIVAGLDERAGNEGFRTLWALPERPDAIFFATSPQMLGALDAMRAMGIAASDRPLIIFFGMIEAARFLDQPYICAAQPALTIGARVVEEAVRRVGTRGTVGQGMTTIEIPVRIIDDSNTETDRYL